MSKTSQRSGDPGRPPWVLAAEALSVTIFALLAVPLTAAAGIALWKARLWWALVAGPVAGYLMADFASGTVHWFGDTFYEENTPLLGPLLIRTFREHHRDPESITRHGFLEVNGCNCLGLIPMLLFEWWLSAKYPDSTPALLCQAFLVTFVVAVFGTNQFHKWAHARRVPAIVAWLQRRNLILSPTMHQRHHRGGFKRSYCITTGWMNTVLDRIRFFPAMEKAIRALNPN
jgi:plasmanylethanolamine desaturase